jgi:hypothetical protein
VINITRHFIDETSDFLRAFREAFWELADRAERTRARLRVRREQAALARREAVICGQLGRMGFALMEDGVSLIRTPEVAALIEDIGRMAADQQQKERRLTGELSEMAGFDWRRLSQQFEAGECVLTQIRVAPDAPGCGRSLTTDTPAALCRSQARRRALPGLGRLDVPAGRHPVRRDADVRDPAVGVLGRWHIHNLCGLAGDNHVEGWEATRRERAHAKRLVFNQPFAQSINEIGRSGLR